MLLEVTALLVAHTVVALAIGIASRNRGFMLLLLVYGSVLSIGSVFSMLASAPLEPGGAPYLAGSDGEGYFVDAVRLVDEGIASFQDLITANYFGYQIFLAGWFTVFGPSLAVALFANNLLLMLACAALFRATELLTGSPRAACLACLAMMLTTAHIYYSMLLLKEPAIGLAFALMLLAVTEALKRHTLGLRPLVVFLLGLFIVISMRGALLLFVFVLLGYLATLFARRRMHALLILAAAVGMLAPLAQMFTTYTLDAEFLAETVTLNTVIAATLDAGEVDAEGVVGRVAGSYLDLPFVARVALFAVPTLLQVMLPFDFWSTAFIDDHFSALFSRNLHPLWYLFVAVWAFFALWHWRAMPEPLLRRFLLAGATFYVMIAVIFGGAIPRYVAPALYFIYPAIGYWWDRSQREPAVRARVRVFFRRYFAALPLLLLPYLVFNLLRAL